MALTALLSVGAPVAAESLGDVVREHRVTAGQGMSLRTPVTSHAVPDDAKRFVIASYEQQGGPALVAPLSISRLDRASGRWAHAAFDERRMRAASSGCLGSVLSVRPAGPRRSRSSRRTTSGPGAATLPSRAVSIPARWPDSSRPEARGRILR
jgi:hypothetical protein